MLRRSRNPGLFLLASVIVASGCYDASGPVDPGAQPDILVQQSAQDPTPSPIALARAIPGFGGVFLDRNGVPSVYLTDAQQQGTAKRALTAFAQRHGFSASAVRVLRGDFNYLDLDRWHNQASPEALAVPGSVFTDLDEANNRVVIGVENASANANVRSLIARLNIPSSAVVIRQTAPVEYAATLRDKVRPIVGGLQIHFGNFLCTLGFNSRDGTESSFITNSHCTNKQGGVEGTQYYQPLSSVDPTVVATEVEDPTYFRGGACPRGRKCRYSDASRARYNISEHTLGSIARTTGTNNSSLTIDGSFSITTEYTSSNFVVGQTVNKIGRTTGWTSGPITNSCVNTNVSGTNITQLCQVFVNAGVGSGDSGSNVFFDTGGGTVTLYGILWGGSGSSTFVFSPFGQIERELGDQTVTAGS